MKCINFYKEYYRDSCFGPVASESLSLCSRQSPSYWKKVQNMWKEIPVRRNNMCKGPEARKNKQKCVRGLNIMAVEPNGEMFNYLGFFLVTNRESLKDFKEIG